MLLPSKLLAVNKDVMLLIADSDESWNVECEKEQREILGKFLKVNSWGELENFMRYKWPVFESRYAASYSIPHLFAPKENLQSYLRSAKPIYLTEKQVERNEGKSNRRFFDVPTFFHAQTLLRTMLQLAAIGSNIYVKDNNGEDIMPISKVHGIASDIGKRFIFEKNSRGNYFVGFLLSEAAELIGNAENITVTKKHIDTDTPGVKDIVLTSSVLMLNDTDNFVDDFIPNAVTHPFLENNYPTKKVNGNYTLATIYLTEEIKDLSSEKSREDYIRDCAPMLVELLLNTLIDRHVTSASHFFFDRNRNLYTRGKATNVWEELIFTAASILNNSPHPFCAYCQRPIARMTKKTRYCSDQCRVYYNRELVPRGKDE
ncbi:MAG: hypothetical protein FWE48_05280 [Coriobacteriia bacterium]|nr:hypothetical protein [Coriobacteriia bacterium]MCL2870642.1 hypothetical protein [Coriobacteriia bacterium]